MIFNLTVDRYLRENYRGLGPTLSWPIKFLWEPDLGRQELKAQISKIRSCRGRWGYRPFHQRKVRRLGRCENWKDEHSDRHVRS